MAAPTERAANRLREHRHRLGLEQWQVAERLSTLAAQHGLGEIALDQHAVSRHERGKHRPQRHYRALYCALYGVDDQILWPRPCYPAPLHDPVLCAPWHHAGTVEAATAFSRATATGGDGLVHRRSFLVLAGTSLTAPAHQWLVQKPGRLTAALGGDRITAPLVGQLGVMIGNLRRMDDVYGPRIVLSLAEHQVSWVVGLLRNGSYTEAVGRGLHTTLAELGQIAGNTARDSGDHGRSQRWYLTALRAAHTADDVPLGACVLEMMSSLAVDLDRLDDAATLIDTAVAGARGSAAANQRAVLNAYRAKIYALRGDKTEAAHSLAVARTDAERFDRAANPTWHYWLGPADITIRAGEAMILADRPADAESLLADGIASLPADRHLGDRQHFMLKLATAQAANHNLHAAVDTGQQAFDLFERRPSTRTGAKIMQFCRALPRSADTTELVARAQALTERPT
jgi:hypothetical protein